jgi:hypothetical protein
MYEVGDNQSVHHEKALSIQQPTFRPLGFGIFSINAERIRLISVAALAEGCFYLGKDAAELG